MAKSKRPYSSIAFDADIYANPNLLQSDAMKRIEEEQQEKRVPAEAVQPNVEANKPVIEPVSVPVSPAPVEEVPVAETTVTPTQQKSKKENLDVRNIFSKDNMHEKDFASAILHHDVMEDLHELARIRDESGKRYPVKYLASNIIRLYLQEHEAELEAIKTQFRKRRG